MDPRQLNDSDSPSQKLQSRIPSGVVYIMDRPKRRYTMSNWITILYIIAHLLYACFGSSPWRMHGNRRAYMNTWKGIPFVAEMAP